MATGTGISLGERAPGFTLPDTEGRAHRLEEPSGGSGQGPEDSSAQAAATVVYWTCNHCPYALAWEDRMHAVSRDYAGRGVRFLAVNSNDADRYPHDSPEAMRERVEREGGWPHPYLYDASQEIAHAYGAQRTPDVFVLDRELRLRYRGAPDDDYDDPSRGARWLREALDAVLAGEAPPRPETEPVGCTIKWAAGRT
jgi:hypothetical protein